MVDLADQPSFQQSIKDVSMKSNPSSKRGRKPIPLKWSRIIDIDEAGFEKHTGHDIDEDMENLEDEVKRQKRRIKKEWAPLFHPKQWWSDNTEHDLQSHLMD